MSVSLGQTDPLASWKDQIVTLDQIPLVSGLRAVRVSVQDIIRKDVSMVEGRNFLFLFVFISLFICSLSSTMYSFSPNFSNKMLERRCLLRLCQLQSIRLSQPDKLIRLGLKSQLSAIITQASRGERSPT